MKIDTPDLVVLLAYMVGVVLFGLWVGRRPRGIDDYTVGGRDVPWWVVLFSIVATETSTATFLSIPGIAYGGDMTWVQLPLGYVVGRMLVVALLLPHYFKGKLLTAYEVLHHRFGGATKTVASLLFLVTRNAGDGLRLFLAAIVLEQVVGMNLAAAVVAVGVATIAYTFFGGMKAVVWTDALQFMIYMLGAGVALTLLLDHIGGWERFVELSHGADKLRLFDFEIDFSRPYVFWAGLLGGAFLTIGTHGTDQMMVQRYLCARTQRQAGAALGLSGVVVLLQILLFLLIGVALWAFYQLHHPDQEFARADQVFAMFIVHEMPSGVRGVLLGAVFSAAMSTLSSSLNSSATAAVHDLWVPSRPAATDADRLAMTRRFTIFFGLVQIAVGIAGQWTAKAVVDSVLSIQGFTTGIILGVFLLGVLTRRVDQRAALAGLGLGLTGMTLVWSTTDLAWPWFAMVGSLGTLALGYLASLCLGRSS